MKRCTRCVMPDTRPGLQFNEAGVCQACLRYEARKTIDWDARWKELVELAETLKKQDHPLGFHCLVAVSGGKDSHAQMALLKNQLGLNPLMVSVSNMPGDWTTEGEKNFRNIVTVFGSDCLSLQISPKTARQWFRFCFETYGSPTWYWDRAVYTYPLWMASALGIKTVFYGENISWEYGGPEAADTPCAANQLDNGVAKDLLVPSDFPAHWIAPPEASTVQPRYLSYYIPWSGTRNRSVAEAHGFTPARPGSRDGFLDNYDQIDAEAYLVHAWMKYPKYGHARATDMASGWIREGLMTRAEALTRVREEDGKLDGWIKTKFCEFCGYTPNEFDEIVSRFYNRDLFRYDEEKKQWILLESEESEAAE